MFEVKAYDRQALASLQDLTLVVPTYNRPVYLERLLGYYAVQDLPP